MIQTRPERPAQEGPDGIGNNKPRLVLEVVNLDSMASRARMGSGTLADVMVDAIRRFAPDLIVVDESHKIKGVGANSSRALARVTDFVKRRVLLTGTVMPHSPLDVFAQWRFLEPYAFGQRLSDGTVKRATFGNFKDRFAELGGWMGKEVIGFKDLDVMQDIMAKNAIVARKEDALPDLPKVTPVVVPVLLSAAEKKAYKEMADNLSISMPTVSATANNRLTQRLRLRQITSGYIADDTGTLRVIGQSKVSTIKAHVQDTLTSEKRIVIFSYFTDEIDLLRQAMESMQHEAKAEVMTITGATPVEERLRMRKRFGSDDPARMVMIAQVKTMSLAVNELVTANHAIFGSLSEQRDDLIQAIDRLNRLGQTRPVTIWFMLAPGTVDEVIMQSHNDRTSVESAVLAHIQQVHEGGVDQSTAHVPDLSTFITP
jgi:SNF2 family DNA or RNA helicase